MTTPLSLIARKARMLGLRDALDVDGARMQAYTGVPPASPSLATAEVLLGTILLSAQCGVLGQSAGLATLTMAVPKTDMAVASGVIGWLRLTNGALEGFIDLPVGLPGSGAPAIVNVAQVFTGGEIQLISCIFAE